MNVAAILSAHELEKLAIPATREQQKRLIRFTGFGAGDHANGMFRRPGEVEFRDGWDDRGKSLETAVSESDYSSLSRCTQYAHFTPGFIIRAIWSGLQRMGWRGGRVLEPGIGTGLFPALTSIKFHNSYYAIFSKALADSIFKCNEDNNRHGFRCYEGGHRPTLES